jgi:hypothetical protein
VSLTISVAGLPQAASGQSVAPASSQSQIRVGGETAGGDLPSDARRLLEDVRDNVTSFDEPAFYWLCRFVRSATASRDLSIAAGETPVQWSLLLDSPARFRGRAVLVEGVLRSSTVYDVANRADVGRLLQCELSDSRTQALCTVVCPGGEAELPRGTLVRAKGYFLKVRSFRARSGAMSAGPLVIAGRLEPITPSSADSGGSARGDHPGWSWMMGGLALFTFAWLILRRWVARGTGPAPAASRSHPRGPSAGGQGQAVRSTAESDFDWLLRANDIDGQANS